MNKIKYIIIVMLYMLNMSFALAKDVVQPKVVNHKTTKNKLTKRTIADHKLASAKHIKHVKQSNHDGAQKKHNNYMQGVASYYGENDGFDGRLMANGKVFHANDVYSAAHPTLPLGTKLMVTNTRNGRTIYVEVRDRMPKGSRVIDLSVAAARYLGMHKRGLARVNLVMVDKDEFEQNKHYLGLESNDPGNQG